MVREILPARRLICLTTLLTATQPTGLSCQMSLRATKCHRNEKTQNPWKNAPKQQKETEEKMVFGWRKKKGIQGDCFGHTEGGGGVVHDRREGVWVFGGGEGGGRGRWGEMGSARCQGARQGCDCTEYWFLHPRLGTHSFSPGIVHHQFISVGNIEFVQRTPVALFVHCTERKLMKRGFCACYGVLHL